MSNKQESNIPWWAIVLGFMFFWPLGMVLLFLNLGGVSIPIDQFRQNTQQGYRPNAQQQRYTPPTAGARSGYSQGTAQGSTAGTGAGAAKSGQGTAQRAYSYGGTSAAGQSQGKQGTTKNRFFRKPKSGKFLTALGGIMSFIFGIGLVSEIADYGLLYPGEWFPVFGFFCAGLVTLWNGLSRTRFGRR